MWELRSGRGLEFTGTVTGRGGMLEGRWCADIATLHGVMHRLRGVTRMDMPGADTWAEVMRRAGR